jgi:hypothetical protein
MISRPVALSIVYDDLAVTIRSNNDNHNRFVHVARLMKMKRDAFERVSEIRRG